MKKASLYVVLLLIICSFFGACSIKKVEPQLVTLGFDRTEAYFQGEIALLPIAGNVPANNDFFEEATVKITADSAVKMQLKAVFDAENIIPDLMVSINGGTPEYFLPDIVLYESQNEETEAEINIKIFLKSSADAKKSSEKLLEFSLYLSYEKNE